MDWWCLAPQMEDTLDFEQVFVKWVELSSSGAETQGLQSTGECEEHKQNQEKLVPRNNGSRNLFPNEALSSSDETETTDSNGYIDPGAAEDKERVADKTTEKGGAVPVLKKRKSGLLFESYLAVGDFDERKDKNNRREKSMLFDYAHKFEEPVMVSRKQNKNDNRKLIQQETEPQTQKGNEKEKATQHTILQKRSGSLPDTFVATVPCTTPSTMSMEKLDGEKLLTKEGVRTSNFEASVTDSSPTLVVLAVNDSSKLENCIPVVNEESSENVLDDQDTQIRLCNDIFNTSTEQSLLEQIIPEIEVRSQNVTRALSTALSDLKKALKTNSMQKKLLNFRELRTSIIQSFFLLDAIDIKIRAEDIMKYEIPNVLFLSDMQQITMEEKSDYFLKILVVTFLLREPKFCDLESNLTILHYRLVRVLNFYTVGKNTSETEGNFQTMIMAIMPRVKKFKIQLMEITRTWDHVRTFHHRSVSEESCVLFEQSQLGFIGFSKLLYSFMNNVRNRVYRERSLSPPLVDTESENYSFEFDMNLLMDICGHEAFKIPPPAPFAAASNDRYRPRPTTSTLGYSVPRLVVGAFGSHQQQQQSLAPTVASNIVGTPEPRATEPTRRASQPRANGQNFLTFSQGSMGGLGAVNYTPIQQQLPHSTSYIQHQQFYPLVPPNQQRVRISDMPSLSALQMQGNGR